MSRSTTSHYEVNIWANYPSLILVHPISDQEIYSLECFPIDLGEVKKININANRVFYVRVILLTPLSNCQDTMTRRKEEEDMEGVVHNCLESNLSSLRWRDGNESSVLLEHANAVK